MDPVILHTARRHGIADPDMLHAYRNTIWTWELDDGFVMHTGPARDARLLEVGVISSAEGTVLIIHAMPARPQYTR